MKNWCSFDAMTVRKRTDLRLLNDLLSPISEPWNDVFQTQEKPVNALLSGIYRLLVDGRGRRTWTLGTRFWRQCWNLSHAPTPPRFWGFVAIRAADASRIDAILMMCWVLHRIIDALEDEFEFRGLDCGENCRSIRKSKWEMNDAQNLHRIKQRKGNQ